MPTSPLADTSSIAQPSPSVKFPKVRIRDSEGRVLASTIRAVKRTKADSEWLVIRSAIRRARAESTTIASYCPNGYSVFGSSEGRKSAFS